MSQSYQRKSPRAGSELLRGVYCYRQTTSFPYAYSSTLLRSTAATYKLLDLHACQDVAAVQVPLLLSLGEMESALTKAIDSGDTDLVYLALFRSEHCCSLVKRITV